MMKRCTPVDVMCWLKNLGKCLSGSVSHPDMSPARVGSLDPHGISGWGALQLVCALPIMPSKTLTLPEAHQSCIINHDT